MPSLDDLKKRISSVKSTQKITKAMKMVAAAKLRRAQESAEKGRPFSEKMNNIILNLSNSIPDKDNASKFLIGNGKDNIHLCVVITADRGLCGGFNTNICRKANNYFEITENFSKRYPNFIYQLQFEKLVNDPETESKKLMKFCALPWDKKCLEFYKRKDLISKTTSNVQIRKAIYKHSLDKYLPYKQFLDKYGKRYSWFN